MLSNLVAARAILLDFHTVRHGLLFLCGIVVALLAFCAGKSNLGTHCFSSEFIMVALNRATNIALKKESCFDSPDYYNIVTGASQEKFYK